MIEQEILDLLQTCTDCKTCNDSCDTYVVTQEELKSPNGRLKTSRKIFNNDSISGEERIGLYTCTLCGICDQVCQQNIPIADIIHSAKIKLVEQGNAPLDIHNKIIKGIIEKDNSVNGEPDKRLDWIPQIYRDIELFEKKNSDTLLFLGCMSSFRVKESASASYLLLKEADYDFKILEKEPCCGEYIYSAGNLNMAKKLFQENFELFKKNRIKKIIVTCGGCLYAFDKVYPKYFKDFNIEVKHVIEVIHELEKGGKIKFNSLSKSITYHDPCRLGRKYVNGPLYNEPRELLKKCGIKIKELVEEHDNCPCCGAGSGIRGVDNSICIKIGKQLFDKIETRAIATSCPLCVFNFRYVNYKNEADKECKYITDLLLEALKNKI
jgi:Fe-S oxidoreductase